jgi:hypothetical protein
MKTLLSILIVVFLVILPISLFAATAEWNPPTQNEDGTPLTDLSGFNLYEVTGGGHVKVNTVLISTTICTGSPSLCTYSIPSGVVVKHDSFVVTAVDSYGSESVDSISATYNVKPKPGANLIIRTP